MTEFCKPHHFSCSLWVVCGFQRSLSPPPPTPPPPFALLLFRYLLFPSNFVFCLEGFTIAFHSITAQVSLAAVKGYEAESSQTLKLTRRNTDDTRARAHTPTHKHTRRPAALSSPHCLLTSLSRETHQCCHKLCFAVACSC